MTREEMVEAMKKHDRWTVAWKRITGEDRTALKTEEIWFVNAVTNLEAQIEARAMTEATKESAKMAKRAAFWTMCMAIATFLLATASAAAILLNAITPFLKR